MISFVVLVAQLFVHIHTRATRNSTVQLRHCERERKLQQFQRSNCHSGRILFQLNFVEEMIESGAESSAEKPPSFGAHRGGGLRLSLFAKEAIASVNETGLLIKVISLLLFITYILTLIWPSLIDVLTVTPGLFWPPHFYIWTAFTFW